MNKLNQKGFTAIEALITLIICGLIVLLGVWFAKSIGSTIDRRNSERGRGDAQVGDVDNEPRKVFQMPDRFGNVAMFCDEFGNAVYTTTSDPNRSLHTLKDGCE